MVFEDPLSHALSLLRAAPRSWLSGEAGEEPIAVSSAPTTHGRVSFNVSANGSLVTVSAQLQPFDSEAANGAANGAGAEEAPPVTVCLRRPSSFGKIKRVKINGKDCRTCWSGEVITLSKSWSGSITATVSY